MWKVTKKGSRLKADGKVYKYGDTVPDSIIPDSFKSSCVKQKEQPAKKQPAKKEM